MSSVRTDRVVVVGILLVIFTLVGCTRGYYRRQADREAYSLIESHATDPRWHLDDYCLEPSPASRMFDPASPDCEPMPPDDPAAHRYMKCVDCKKGWPCWRCYGKTPYVENPYWRSYLPLDEKGDLALDRQAAVQMALLNSRDYQQALENLYFSALNVSLQRFQFDVQFFGQSGGANSVTQQTFTGSRHSGFGAPSELSTTTSLEASRYLATGGQLIVDLANSLVWQFSGPNQSLVSSTLGFELTQPLLRNGGRAFALELLTDSERALLANARQMERFRHGFSTQVITGRAPGAEPVGNGLDIGNLTPGGPAGVGGFLGLLQAQVQIRNQRSNVSGLQTSLEQLQAFYEAGRVGRVQVDQARQSVYNAQSNLLSIVRSYEDDLDSYKIALGLPPDLTVRIADALLDRFDLIAPALTETQDAVVALTRSVGDETVALPDDYLQRTASLEQRVLAQVEQVRRDLAALQKATPERQENLRRLSEREEVRSGQVEHSVVDVAVFEARVKRVTEEFAILEPKIQATLGEIQKFVQHPPDPSQMVPQPLNPPGEADANVPEPPAGSAQSTPPGAAGGLPPGLQPTMSPEQKPPGVAPSPRDELATMLTTLAGQMRTLSLLQAASRLDAVTLVPVDLAPEKAFQIACENRLDWMNARAILVDWWRQIEFTANALRSDLNLRVGGDISTVGNNPVRFRSSNGQLRLGVEFTAPLTRLVQRNQYRTALIQYQEARRAYYAYEDAVNQGLRAELRLLRLDQLNFEVSRTAAFNAVSQVESAQVGLERPPKPGETGQLSPTTARDLTDALSGLLSAQNSFVSIWVDYEAQRMSLDLDLGTMQLDASGMWIDPGPIGADNGQGEQPRRPEEIPAGTVGERLPEAPEPPEPAT